MRPFSASLGTAGAPFWRVSQGLVHHWVGSVGHRREHHGRNGVVNRTPGGGFDVQARASKAPGAGARALEVAICGRDRGCLCWRHRAGRPEHRCLSGVAHAAARDASGEADRTHRPLGGPDFLVGAVRRSRALLCPFRARLPQGAPPICLKLVLPRKGGDGRRRAATGGRGRGKSQRNMIEQS